MPVKTLTFVALAPLFALTLAGSAASAESWQTVITCTAATPKDDQQLTLYYSFNGATDKATVQIRVGTKDVVLGTDEKGVESTLEIEGQGVFALEARGAGNEKNPLVILAVPPESKVLSAISRGYKATVKIPTAGGEKIFAFDLAGSGAAVKHISRCLP